MKRNLLLSIVVPVYNSVAYLNECLESICAQSYANFECILVDDGSDDGSSLICDKYCDKDKRFQTIHKKHSGVSDTRKIGLEHTNGELLAFVDSDDLLDREMFKRLVKPFELKNVDISICGHQPFKLLSDLKKDLKEPCFYYLTSEVAIAKMINEEGFTWSLWGKVYRRDLFLKYADIENWPESYGEDVFINWHILRKTGIVAYGDFEGYFYRIHYGSLMRQSFSCDRLAYLKIWIDIYREAKDFNDNETIKCGIYRLFLRNGIHIVWQFRHIELNETNEKILNRYCDTMRNIIQSPEQEKILFPYQKNFLRWLGEDYKHLLEEEINQVRKFAISHSQIWIYGMGDIGRDIMLILKHANISCMGYVVTKKSEDIIEHQLNVYSFLQLKENKMNKETGLILAMTKRNCDDVITMLRNNGYSQDLWLNASAMSYRYFF